MAEQQQQQQLLSLLRPWALVQVELQQLTGVAAGNIEGLQALSAMLGAAARLDAAAYAALKRSLLQPVLQLLTKVPASGSSSAGSSSSSHGSAVELDASQLLFKLLDEGGCSQGLTFVTLKLFSLQRLRTNSHL
jgi:hypothetical protein